MADPFTLSFIAANCAWAMIQNRADAAAVGSAKRLAEALRKQKTPANHDVLAATHAAFVRSIQLMAEACERSGGNARDHFVARALARVANDRDLTTFNADTRAIPTRELDASIRAIFEGAEADPSHNATEAVIVRLEQAMGEPLTGTFRALFRHGSDKHHSWPQAFELFFAEQVKTNERVFRTLAFDRLNEILAFAEEHWADLSDLDEQLGRVRYEMHDRFERLEGMIAQQAGVPLATIEAIAQAFGEFQPEADAAAIETYLRAKADEYHRYRERAEAMDTRDNHSRVLLGQAQEAIDSGHFDEADSLIAEAEEHDAEISSDLRLAADQRDIDRSAKRALRGDAAKLKGDYGGAIAHYDAAAEMLPRDATQLRLKRRDAAAKTCREWGEISNPAALREGARRWRALTKSVDRVRSPEQWAKFQNGLAITLSILARQEKGIKSVGEAVKVYGALLKALSRSTFKREWAITQNNLANALMTLGSRQKGTKSIERAVKASLAALEVLSSKDDPLDLAMVHVTTGNAYQELGIREEGTLALELAIAAYQSALQIYTFELQPNDWATVQNNLGSALQVLGSRDGSTGKLDQAAMAFSEALRVYVKESFPLDWAMTQNNLGNTLSEIGSELDDEETLQRAVGAFNNALTIYSRRHLPIYWATAQNNLGGAHLSLAMLKGDASLLDKAIDAYRAALEVRTRELLPRDWMLTKENLGRVLMIKGAVRSDHAASCEAVQELTEAVRAATHPKLSGVRAGVEKCLAMARQVRDSLV